MDGFLEWVLAGMVAEVATVSGCSHCESQLVAHLSCFNPRGGVCRRERRRTNSLPLLLAAPCAPRGPLLRPGLMGPMPIQPKACKLASAEPAALGTFSGTPGDAAAVIPYYEPCTDIGTDAATFS